MRKVLVFNNVSLDGYFVDSTGSMSWAHVNDPEWQAFTTENAQGKSEALFGRVTYQMMASYWPTPMAAGNSPDVARAMNEMPKVVFSRTLNDATWANTRLVKDDVPGEVRRMKEEAGPGILVMGSGTIVAQLAQAGLIDEFMIAVHPVVLGAGRSMFAGVTGSPRFGVTRSRTFKNGAVVLWATGQQQATA